MFTFPCPWCDHALVMSETLETVSRVRCEDCATVVDLAPHPAAQPADTLPLAA